MNARARGKGVAGRLRLPRFRSNDEGVRGVPRRRLGPPMPRRVRQKPPMEMPVGVDLSAVESRVCVAAWSRALGNQKEKKGKIYDDPATLRRARRHSRLGRSMGPISARKSKPETPLRWSCYEPASLAEGTRNVSQMTPLIWRSRWQVSGIR